MFMKNMKETMNEEFNTSVTENGAVGYKTTGKELLDINFSVTSMRNWIEEKIVDKFVKAYYENPKLACKWIFYVRDAREGVGERRLFRILFKYLAENHPDICKVLIPYVPVYGRWDDLWVLLDTSLAPEVSILVIKQLSSDIANMNDNDPISLLGKWMPSINTSSEETRRLARKLMQLIGCSDEKQYRKLLSKLRAYLNVVEVKMSSGEWSSIDYSAVPSRANLIYNSAFLKNDEDRRRRYLESLQKGVTKINAGVLFPHDIVHKYRENGGYGYYRHLGPLEVTYEELWKALPDYVKGAGNTICVADGSGSMDSCVGGTRVTALEVANALAIYFAERCTGQFKDNYITFSENPQLVDLSNGRTLRDKIEIALRHNEVANTNIEAVFDLILETAIKHNMKQEDLPQNILILSDMEFDSCVVAGSVEPYNPYARRYSIWDRPARRGVDKKLFNEIAQKYTSHGYKLPRLVFWNICSRTGTIPVKENDLGVALVSGFSPAIVKMVLSNSTDPFECLLEQLNSDRYLPIEAELNKVFK